MINRQKLIEELLEEHCGYSDSNCERCAFDCLIRNVVEALSKPPAAGIDKQKLIEELEWQIAHWQESVDEFHDKEEIGVVKGLKLALEKINSQPPADQWIPCSERLPEDDTPCLITITPDFGCMPFVMAAYYDFDGKVWGYNDDDGWMHRIVNVTAWMPLPEPYTTD